MVLKRSDNAFKQIIRFTVVLYWMVLKPSVFASEPIYQFYSSVILNGTETFAERDFTDNKFYSSVILNGTETGDHQGG